MIKRIFSLALSILFITSCSNSGNKDVTSTVAGSDSPIKVEFASLIDNPGNYIDKDIIVEGKVVHVCTQSGKKLFIVGENPDVRLFISAGEDMPKFPMDLLGSEVIVEGTITKVGGIAMAGEAVHNPSEAKGTEAGMKTADEECETETALANQPSLTNIVMQYKSHSVK